MVKKAVKCSGCEVGLKIDASPDANGEEADAKCRQVRPRKKWRK